jgi:hypothetical protein
MSSLAMAEMTALTATIYREYQTSLVPEFQNATPGITARFEVFYDEKFPVMKVSRPEPAMTGHIAYPLQSSHSLKILKLTSWNYEGALMCSQIRQNGAVAHHREGIVLWAASRLLLEGS